MINPLGFTLEHFDAVGRYRDKEKGKPIDATGIPDPRRRDGEVRRRPRAGRRSWPAARRRTTPSSSSCSTTWSSSRSAPTARRRWPTCGDRSPRTASTSASWWWRSWPPSALTPRERAEPTMRDQTRLLTDRALTRFTASSRFRLIDLTSETTMSRPAPAASSSATWASARRPCRSSSTCPAWASPTRRGGSSGWSSCSAPTASCPRTFWPDEEGDEVHAQGEPQAAGAVPGPHADPARRLRQGPRRRRQPHARHRLPADRHRAVPRQHPGRLATRRPAGPAASRSTRRSRISCRSDAGDAHPLRLAGVRRDGARPGRHLDAHGLRRAEQADRADRRSRTRCSPSSTAG